ncbi:hypothetical protein IJ843_07440 [bacterium]|nr:hypothetical protein [bacterium]
MKKNKITKNKYLILLIITWCVVLGYEFIFMSTKFGLENFFDENSALYTILITVPLVFVFAFLITWIVIAHINEIKNTWKETPEKIIDELKLLGIGALFFLFLCIIYMFKIKYL